METNGATECSNANNRDKRWSLNGATALVTGGSKGIGYADTLLHLVDVLFMINLMYIIIQLFSSDLKSRYLSHGIMDIS